MTKKLVSKLLQYHVFSIVCGLTILILCTIRIPPEDNIPLFPNFDKFVHFTMYFSLCLSYLLESLNRKTKSWRSYYRPVVQALILSAVLGAGIEFIQGFWTDYRSADLLDWFADMVGSLTACLLIGLVRLASR